MQMEAESMPEFIKKPEIIVFAGPNGSEKFQNLFKFAMFFIFMIILKNLSEFLRNGKQNIFSGKIISGQKKK